eukprot:Pompholyxophrys_punicea_v1_NODE_411_length_2028_cov_23.894070.p1 type:complete len:223 gc:universal NODE_411_length_2028_cov_23.894070:1308-1976(+)
METTSWWKRLRKRSQKKIYEQLGLIIDQPRSGGAGSSNNGPTARRFFRSPNKTATATGLNEECLDRLQKYIRALCSGKKLDPKKVKVYGRETAEIWIRNYPWYYTPQAIHRALIHRWQVIENGAYYDIPIDSYTEESSESANKSYKHDRAFHARKFNRLATMTDVIHMRLVNSDPFINSLKVYKKDAHKILKTNLQQLWIYLSKLCFSLSFSLSFSHIIHYT